MLFVLLNYLTRIRIILDDLLISAADQEHILSLICWVKLHTEWSLPICETPYHFPCLCVPELDHFVEACT